MFFDIMETGGNRYSIILPMRNGGAYAKECITSILRQTYPHFNLIILDNSSEDDVPGWINSLNDGRVTVHRSNESLTIEQNWARILQVQTNEFITLIGHDDILDPDFLSIMDRLITQYPTASLYHAHFRYIDATGKTIRKSKPMAEVQRPEIMLTNFLAASMDICGTGYVMRKRDYDATGGIPPYPRLLFADFELWINLARKDHLAVAREECFAFRIHQSTTTSSTDAKLLEAFDRFIEYLDRLRHESPALGDVIKAHAGKLLDFNCQGLSSRLLRTARSDRGGQTVKSTVEQFKQYAAKLSLNDFDPLNNKVTRMALLVDSNALTRSLFLILKKMYPKPVIN